MTLDEKKRKPKSSRVISFLPAVRPGRLLRKKAALTGPPNIFIISEYLSSVKSASPLLADFCILYNYISGILDSFTP